MGIGTIFRKGLDRIRRGKAVEMTGVPTNDPTTSTQMFGNNNAISGGQYYQAQNVIHNYSSQGVDPPMPLLKQQVSASAFHNSAERYDPPRCHENTRVEILAKIRDWTLQSAQNRKTWILWLNGAAGAGKSAIMQSIAELLLLKYPIVAVASFIFSRSDVTRNTIESLVATLAYQLIQQIPEISDIILSVIAHSPLIFKQSLEFQLQQLIIQPLISLPFHMQKVFIIFSDGLDECLNRDHQANLIKVIGNICRGDNIPIVFVIASRREPQIQFEFNNETVSRILETIPLDDSKASDDIRRYLNAKFADIKKTHPLQHLLTPNWPSISTVTEIVEKSSNQFIYASTVIKYISSARANPAQQLKVILDLRLLNPLSEHPFAYLDSLYRHIFSQIENLDQVLDIVAFDIISGYIDYECSAFKLEHIFSMEPGTLQVLFLDLTAVIQFKYGYRDSIRLLFLHASLPDFLLDPARSQQYFLDLYKYCIKFLCMILGRSFLEPLSPNNIGQIADQEEWRIHLLAVLLQFLPSPTLSDQLQCAFMNFDSIFLRHGINQNSVRNSLWILIELKALNIGDQGQAYQHVLALFAEGYASNWTLYDEYTKEYLGHYPNLWAQICQFRPELAM